MSIDAGGLVDLYHQSIEELNQLTEHNFDKFKMINSSTGGVSSPGKPFRSFGSKVRVEEYNGKLSGIIGEMYGLYFYDETNPLDGSPSTIINQSQQQTQSVQVQILLEIQSLIDKKLNEITDETEIGFLEKVKSSLVSIKSVSELINLILATGVYMGMTIDQISKLFK